MRLLEGKGAVVTGCARGIGHSILETFASQGANLWACARKPTEEFEARIAALANKHGVRIIPVYFDFADAEQVKAGAKAIILSKEPVDVLVNNAGVTYNALFQMTPMEKMREVFEVNFFSPFAFTQYIVKLMVRNKKGSVVNIASSAAIDGNSGRGAYGASKASIICVTKAMAEELAEHGIRSNAIAPGVTDTDMVGESMTDQVVAEALSRTCLKRIGQPSEIAGAALFLASDLSSYLTGQVLRVDGGM